MLLVQLMSRIKYICEYTQKDIIISVHVTCIIYGVMQTGQGQLKIDHWPGIHETGWTNRHTYMSMQGHCIEVTQWSTCAVHPVVYMQASADPDHMHIQQVTCMGWCMGRQSETIISYSNMLAKLQAQLEGGSMEAIQGYTSCHIMNFSELPCLQQLVS